MSVDPKPDTMILTPLPTTFSEPTKLERRLYAALDVLGVAFVPQKPIGYYTVDVYLPSAHLAIEADGDMWHCCPACYGDDPSPEGAPAAFIRQRQATRDARLGRYGLTVIHLWGHDLRTDEQTIETLRRALEPFNLLNNEMEDQ